MTVVRRSVAAEAIGPEKLTSSFRAHRYCFETFMQEPLCFVKGTITAPTGSNLEEAIVNTGRYAFEYTFLGTATDAFLPVLASEGGYNWVLTTATLDRGVEINFGGLKDAHPRNFIPRSEDWFSRLLLITSNASGIDAFFGYRRVAAYAATLTEYSDVAGVRILGNSGSTDATVTLITNLNNAGSTDYTSTTPTPAATGLEDATAIEVEVRSVGGVAQFWLNGVRYGGVTQTFDSGDYMTTVARLIQTTDLATQIKTLCYESGPLADRQPGTLLSLAGSTI